MAADCAPVHCYAGHIGCQISTTTRRGARHPGRFPPAHHGTARVWRIEGPLAWASVHVEPCRIIPSCDSLVMKWRTQNAGMLLAVTAWMVLFGANARLLGAETHPGRIKVEYLAPANAEQQSVYNLLKERRALEQLQRLFSPLRLPTDLSLRDGVFPHRSHFARNERSRERDLRQVPRRGREGRADLQAR